MHRRLVACDFVSAAALMDAFPWFFCHALAINLPLLVSRIQKREPGKAGDVIGGLQRAFQGAAERHGGFASWTEIVVSYILTCKSCAARHPATVMSAIYPVRMHLRHATHMYA